MMCIHHCHLQYYHRHQPYHKKLPSFIITTILQFIFFFFDTIHVVTRVLEAVLTFHSKWKNKVFL